MGVELYMFRIVNIFEIVTIEAMFYHLLCFNYNNNNHKHFRLSVNRSRYLSFDICLRYINVLSVMVPKILLVFFFFINKFFQFSCP